MKSDLQEKRKRLKQLLEQRIEPDVVSSKGESSAGSTSLSLAQRRLWFLSELEGSNAAYNIPVEITLNGELNISALVSAVEAILSRHNVLRYRFVDNDGVPSIKIQDIELDLKANCIDKEALAAICEAESRYTFDLRRDALFRIQLYRLAEREHVLLVNMHHTVSDGWSVGIFIRELSELYRAFYCNEKSPLESLTAQYCDYVRWQEQWLKNEAHREQLAFWKRKLENLPPCLDIPLDRPRPLVQSNRGDTLHFQLPEPLQASLSVLGQGYSCTLYMVLMAALNVLLFRYSGQGDIAIGTGIANRRWDEFKGLIGYFVNTLVHRTLLSGELTFPELLQQTRRTALQSFEYQDIPFDLLVEELNPERSMSYSPLIQVMFVLQNMPLEPVVDLPGLQMRARIPDSGSAKFDLSISMQKNASGLEGNIEYRTDLFDRETIQRFVKHYRRLLRQLVADPERSIADYTFLSKKEEHRLLVQWNSTGNAAPGDRSDEKKCLYRLFEDQVERRPDAAALVFGSETLTYAELNRRACRVADYLMAQGVQAETLVGLCFERSVAMLVAMLGVIRAGAAYVPLDPHYPEARLSLMIEDAQLSVILTTSTLKRRIGVLGERALGVDTVPLNQGADSNAPPQQAELRPAHKRLAYVMYTSGSTGKPKGVLIEQGGIIRLVKHSNYIRLNEHTVMAHLSNTAFDAATLEIWGALLNGGQLVHIEKSVLLDARRLKQVIECRGITDMFVTTALFNRVAQDEPACFASVETLLFGGEAVSTQAVNTIVRAGMPKRLLHVYGPTENTTFSTWFAVTAQALRHRPGVPIGRAISKTTLYVLDERRRPVPIGITGELYLGGAGVARGYLNRPELSAERFVSNPFSRDPDERLYRSGDRVRWLPDGQIEFIGRGDDQVKIRGFRIEPGEVEVCLSRQPGVAACAVLAREDQPGDKRLVAYVVPAVPTAAGADETRWLEALRTGLKAVLPDYLLPAAYVRLPALPLTPNGKVDKKALPAPDYQVLAGDYVPPRTETEACLAKLWQQVLQLEAPVGVEANFFNLGGHSLLATRLVAAIRSHFGIELPLKTVFTAQVLSDLARAVEAGGEGEVPPPLAAQRRTPERAPALSFAQQRLWFIDSLEGASPLYNIPVILCLQGALSTVALGRALNTVVQRHESLRTCFGEGEDGVHQVIREGVELILAQTDLSALPAPAREERLRSLTQAEAERPFDLGRDLMLRARLIRWAVEDHRLLLTLHHIAADGWSVDVLLRELKVLYGAYREGRDNPLPALPLQYADYARWQRQWLQGEVLERQVRYWQRQLAGIPPLHSLPLDRPRPALQSFRGATHFSMLEADLTARLLRACRDRDATLYMGLHALFSALLSRYSGAEDIVVGTPVANREQSELAPLIGFFVNTLVMRSDLSGEPGFHTLLARSRETALGAYAHQQIPFEHLVERLQPERSLSHSPLFQVLLALQNNQQEAFELPGLSVSWAPAELTIAKFDLSLNAIECEGGLQLSWEYNIALFEAATIERLARHFRHLMEQALAAPERPLAQLPLLDAQETEQVLRWSRAAESAPAAYGIRYTGPRCIHTLFEAQAGRHPARPALVFEHVQLSYAELNARANRLARYLRGRGVKPDTLVGLCVERGAEMMVAILAILKAGGAYVPLDPNYPPARLAYLLRDAQVAWLITQEALVPRLPANEEQTQVLLLDSDATRAILLDTSCEPLDPYQLGLTADHLAYVIYTSGSTGQPKGVMLHHRGLVNLVQDQARRLDVTSHSRILQFASLSFDAATWEWALALSQGAALILIPQATAADAMALTEIGRRHNVSHTVLPPSMLSVLNPADWPCLTHLMSAGEAISPAEAARWASGRHFFNGYGPTEATICVAVGGYDAARQRVTIGGPVAGTELYVLDNALLPVPPGVAGELYIGGIGLARGYLKRPKLTAERFIPHPFSDNARERLYKTGDLVRWCPPADGGPAHIEYLGRLDQQVKLRGFRIELGEIEAYLCRQPGVAAGLVLAREFQPGDKRLLAYVVPAEPIAAGEDEAQWLEALRAALAAALPNYMVPAAFVCMAALPLTPNGKVDKKALPAPNDEARGYKYVAPQTEAEETIQRIWCNVLGTENISVSSNFFEIGGSSLSLISVHRKICSLFDSRLPLRSLYTSTTIREQARLLSDKASSTWKENAASAAECSSHLVRMSAVHNNQPAVFLFHPIGGDVRCYLKMINRNKIARTVYGVETAGVYFNSVTDMASRYAGEIKRVQTEGPYFLSGWSMGGVIALEVARQLSSAGGHVEHVLLFDSHVPQSESDLNEQEVLFLAAKELGIHIEPGELNAAGSAEKKSNMELGHLAKLAVNQSVLPATEAEALLCRHKKVIKHNFEILRNHTVQVYPGRVSLLCASQNSNPDQIDEWRPLLPKLNAKVIPGNHFTILDHVTGLEWLVGM